MVFHKMLIKINQEHQNDNSSRIQNFVHRDLKINHKPNEFERKLKTVSSMTNIFLAKHRNRNNKINSYGSLADFCK